ncbi:SUMF1/EgtB/PvdO family nonheme iron enzyme [Glaciimonas sp. PCH181]|uniref:SUMF1/EgtB/PvdO family nonheme iron enzyme n=1 Tax=Glaciimonas sp. PCH181 TaxID=2133943 RepID=UPI000D3BC00F|nr:SUMF1/EgtB/PvdO family nonheme iron enzyme [Glaciimonas sp. PCH181]PUA19612.1 hypothetical protein C7W93_07140 [Glaciimonas sp. PCH181]
MNIVLTKEQTFTVRAGVNAIHGLRVVGEWEGLTKLEAPSGDHLIIVADGGQLVKGSDALLHNLRHGLSHDRFITVPETELPNGLVVPSFQVGQYVSTKGDDGKLSILADATPWVCINYSDAKSACETTGYKLITETQWLAIAFNASQQDANWTGGKVGEGKLFQGIRKGNVNSAQPGNYTPTNSDEQRWLTLSNGERICDLSGNVWQWVFDDVQGNEQGLIAKAFASDSPSITAVPYPSEKKGMGYRPKADADWSGNALIRGGYWGSVDYAGAFDLDCGWPGYGGDYVGFRCTK